MPSQSTLCLLMDLLQGEIVGCYTCLLGTMLTCLQCIDLLLLDLGAVDDYCNGNIFYAL